jgi:hypothetical protein
MWVWVVDNLDAVAAFFLGLGFQREGLASLRCDRPTEPAVSWRRTMAGRAAVFRLDD